eukprot:CAMPEP_0175279480 /NCGR_PEP_ID=MMETSP0093-20121207/50066_1 /TAXON_ID=311494 /ORGANISM="Alexandrium monilatum, Strain CCMP3105" /LENGTH=31 /DNA_ID= /DNA_START= /DNA_END= /DNA_ORIENTATION=
MAVLLASPRFRALLQKRQPEHELFVTMLAGS